jgi:hypothetical protein
MNEYKENNVIDVYIKIIKIIPDNEINLKSELELYINTLWNQAPEILVSKFCWIPFINILNNNIPNIYKDWHFEIRKIITNKLIDK